MSSSRYTTKEAYKRNAMRTAKQLQYPGWILDKIESAQTESQITKALITGRKIADRR